MSVQSVSNTKRSASSQIIFLLLPGSWRLFFFMYAQSCLTIWIEHMIGLDYIWIFLWINEDPCFYSESEGSKLGLVKENYLSSWQCRFTNNCLKLRRNTTNFV